MNAKILHIASHLQQIAGLAVRADPQRHRSAGLLPEQSLSMGIAA
jgi:hypothetical protein